MDKISFIGFQEPISSWSHLCGALLFLYLTISELRGVSLPHKQQSVIIFGGSSILLFSTSGVYHLLSYSNSARYILQIIDHAFIYVLIASSFTAIHIILFKKFMKWGFILIIWILAVLGITLGTVFFKSIPEFLSLSFYLIFGWLGMISGTMLWKKKEIKFISYFLFGGISYTIGAVTEFFRFPVVIPNILEAHEIFHFTVLAGAYLHWLFIIQSVKRV